MTGFPRSPRLVKGGLVLIDPTTAAVPRVIALQYNPDTLTRTLQAQAVSSERRRPLGGAAAQGPPVETIKLEAEIDATDQLEFPDQNADDGAVRHPSRSSPRWRRSSTRPARSCTPTTRSRGRGTLEIVPMETPLTLFVWSKSRVVPVRVTEFSVTEEAFDPALNPIRAKVSLGHARAQRRRPRLRPQGRQPVHDLPAAKEQLAAQAHAAALDTLGIGGIP